MGIEDINPTVSIVIPVYNGSNFLAEAIESALAQTYKNIEIIVVDDGSTDEGATEEIAKSYGDRIRYYQKENGGVATALNFGITKMTGKYFSWLSHDDLYEKTKVEDQVNLIRSSDAKNVIVACNARELFQSGIKKEALIDKKAFEYFDIFLATSANVGINGCTLLIPKKALVESGGFDPSLPVTQDYDLWFRLSSKLNYKFVLLEKNLVIYRRHDKQDSVQKQKLCIEAGDKLHHFMLTKIDYKRFEEYFVADKANAKHAWRNYSLYKTGGFRKTASMMLKSILRYYYENDREKFYQVYSSEIETGVSAKDHKRHVLSRSGKLVSPDRQRIVREYNKLVRSGTNDYPIKESSIVYDNTPPRSRVHRIVRQFGESIKRDGLYLTGEKIIRKVHRKVLRGGK